MKYIKVIFTLFCVCCIVATLWISVFADDLYPENTAPTSDNPYYSLDETQPFNQDETQSFNQDETEPFNQDETQTFNQDETQPFNLGNSEPVRSVSDPVIVDTVAPITPSNTNGFQAVVLGLLGNYSPVVIEYAYTNSNGFVSYLREVQPDYSWMASAIMFLVVIYSLFRLIGALIKR